MKKIIIIAIISFIVGFSTDKLINKSRTIFVMVTQSIPLMTIYPITTSQTTLSPTTFSPMINTTSTDNYIHSWCDKDGMHIRTSPAVTSVSNVRCP